MFSNESDIDLPKQANDTLIDIADLCQNCTALKTTPKEICPSHDQATHASLSTFRMWVEGHTLLCIATAGIMLNLSGVCAILQKKKRKKLFNLILLPILISDTSFLASKMLTTVDTLYERFLNLYVLAYLLYPLQRITLFISIFLTTALTHDRYCALTSPITHRSRLRCQEARRKRLWQYLIPSIIGSVIASLPAFGETTIRNRPDDRNPILLPSMVSNLKQRHNLKIYICCLISMF